MNASVVSLALAQSTVSTSTNREIALGDSLVGHVDDDTWMLARVAKLTGMAGLCTAFEVQSWRNLEFDAKITTRGNELTIVTTGDTKSIQGFG